MKKRQYQANFICSFDGVTLLVCQKVQKTEGVVEKYFDILIFVLFPFQFLVPCGPPQTNQLGPSPNPVSREVNYFKWA